MSLCIVYLASPRNFTIQGDSRYNVLRASLRIVRKVLPNIPVVVFHEDYTEEDIQGLPSGIVYEHISFAGCESIYNPALPNAYGYLMMCRFFSGVLQQHPRLQAYTHYLRLDDDSYLLEPYLTERQVYSLLTHDYVYRAMFREVKPQQSLYEFTMRFVKRYVRNSVQMLSIERSLVARKIVTESGQYTGFAPYNNFHLSSLRLWNHPIVRRYIADIELSGGILRYGWLDANIHAMIVFVVSRVMPNVSVIPCTTFGYRHNHHICPLGSIDTLCDMTIPFYPKADDKSESHGPQTEEMK